MQQGGGLIMVTQCTTVEVDGKLYPPIVGSSTSPFLMAAQIIRKKYLLQSPSWSRSLLREVSSAVTRTPAFGESFAYQTCSFVISSGLLVWVHTSEKYR